MGMIEIMGVQYDEGWLEGIQESFGTFVDDLISSTYGYTEELVTETDLPFCGCDTCFAREVLAFLLPKAAAAAKAGLIIV